MEYYSFIESTEPIPSQFNWIKDLRERADKFSEAVRTFDPNKSVRVEECANHIKILKFSNGYQRFGSTKYCRVRGCPVCALANANYVAAVLHRSIPKEGKWTHVKLPVPGHLTNAEAKRALQRFTQRKAWKVNQWFTIVSGATTDSVSYNLFCLNYPKGKNYLSSKAAFEQWGASCKASVGAVKVKAMSESSPVLIAQKMVNSTLDASSVDECRLPEWLSYFHKVKVLSLSGFTRQEREEKELAPSEKLRQDRVVVEHFGWMPNPESEDYSNDYLLMPDAAQMLGNF